METVDASEQFESALALFRSGSDLLAHQGARALLERAPGHVGGMMLLLATAGGCGDDQAIEGSLLEISEHYEQLLAIPEVLELLRSDLLAPVVRSRTFRVLFAPALLHADLETREGRGREVMGRLVQEAVRDAAIEAALAEAPLTGTAPVMTGEAIHVVDMATGEAVANLRGDRPHLVGRVRDADVRLDDAFVSREHLHLVRRAGVWVAQSLMPTNPPVLNGRPMGMMPAPLRHGDELRVGHLALGVFSGLGEVVAAPEPDEVDGRDRTRSVLAGDSGAGLGSNLGADGQDLDVTFEGRRPDDRGAAESRPHVIRRHA